MFFPFRVIIAVFMRNCASCMKCERERERERERGGEGRREGLLRSDRLRNSCNGNMTPRLESRSPAGLPGRARVFLKGCAIPASGRLVPPAARESGNARALQSTSKATPSFDSAVGVTSPVAFHRGGHSRRRKEPAQCIYLYHASSLPPTAKKSLSIFHGKPGQIAVCGNWGIKLERIPTTAMNGEI